MLSAGITWMPKVLFGENPKTITRGIPSSGERIPVIGMGTSRTFDVADDPTAREQLEQVLQTFFDNGGAVIDSSPMYGSAVERRRENTLYRNYHIPRPIAYRVGTNYADRTA